ncbi:MAG: serine/threonine-protein kinase, partial [Pseudomonadota bacterium]
MTGRHDTDTIGSAGRYVVLDLVAEGGMGAIFLGRRLGGPGPQDQFVVLKQLLPEHTADPTFVDMFLREARISAALDHPNIVRTLDLVGSGESYFIVMEYVPGGDLRTLLRRAKLRGRQIPVAAAVLIIAEILEALAHAHSRKDTAGRPLGLIHRDVSPSNILLSDRGSVKLTDFGIAKATTSGSVFFRVKGKLGYMSPEQARGGPVDARTDIFAAAVCLHEILSGERLFVATTITASADDIYRHPVPWLSKKRADVPPELDDVILKALRLDPEERFQSAHDLRRSLLLVAQANGLLISNSELADRLTLACGPAAEWRSAIPDSLETHKEEWLASRSRGTEKVDLLEDFGLEPVVDDLSSGVPSKEQPARDSAALTRRTVGLVAALEKTGLINAKTGGTRQRAARTPTPIAGVELTSLVAAREAGVSNNSSALGALFSPADPT